MEKKIVKVGIIGGGMMGKEIASAFGRWFVLKDYPVKPVLCALCDINSQIFGWYRQIDSVTQFTTNYKELLANEDIDVVYVAVPHHLHQKIFIDVMEAGKDLLGEKPFGIGLNASQSIYSTFIANTQFVRASSEFPFLPGAQAIFTEVQKGNFGKILQVRTGLLHASDLNPNKPINWKRQVKYCGEIGVMGDLGMHTMHLPLRLGWRPKRVYAQLQNITSHRSDSTGKLVACDTWDNATLHTDIDVGEQKDIPMMIETKRMAPTEKNTWAMEVLGTDGGVKYSTKEPKTLWTYRRKGQDQFWEKRDLSFNGNFKTITGDIVESGFPDWLMQMLAAYFLEREGLLDGKFGCATPEEALWTHHVFQAALESNRKKNAVEINYDI